MHSSPVAFGKVRSNTFPIVSQYMAVISLKSGLFAVALLDKTMPLSLSPQCKYHDPR